MGDPPRRRRYEGNGDGGRRQSRGIPWFPLAIIVIFAGFLIGGIAGRLFGGAGGPAGNGLPPGAPHVEPLPSNGGQSPSDMPTPTPFPTPSPIPTPSSATSATPSPVPTPTGTPKPTPSASASPSKSPAAAPTATPHKAVPVPAALPSATAAPVTPAPAHATPPAPAAAPLASGAGASGGAAGAEAVVRSYLSALSRGDNATAATYLTNGSPSETFMGPTAQIVSVQAKPGGTPGVYKVGADIKASGGEYYSTFMVEPGPSGYQIYDHYTIKP